MTPLNFLTSFVSCWMKPGISNLVHRLIVTCQPTYNKLCKRGASFVSFDPFFLEQLEQGSSHFAILCGAIVSS